MNSHLSQIHLVFPFSLKVYMGLWGLSGKESTGHTGDTGSIPGLGRSPGEGNGNLLLSGKSHGQRNLVGYSPKGHKRAGHD